MKFLIANGGFLLPGPLEAFAPIGALCLRGGWKQSAAPTSAAGPEGDAACGRSGACKRVGTAARQSRLEQSVSLSLAARAPASRTKSRPRGTARSRPSALSSETGIASPGLSGAWGTPLHVRAGSPSHAHRCFLMPPLLTPENSQRPRFPISASPSMETTGGRYISGQTPHPVWRRAGSRLEREEWAGDP